MGDEMDTQTGFPLHTGQPGDFAAVRQFLQSSGFTEDFVLSHFELPTLNSVLLARGLLGEQIREKYHEHGIGATLARLFLGGYPAGPADLGVIPSRVQEAMRTLGLLDQRNRCPVLLYPALGFFVSADRGLNEKGEGYDGLDYVMSGAEEICRQYVASIGQSPCGMFLEIGTGSGLAALVASNFAEHVWALDITPRATRYAEFNRKLNGIDHMTVLCGDLFAPVEGMRFDRIACNPPFEPPLKQGMIFSVGGEDGEAIMARLIAGTADHLTPGGRLYCQVAGTDREGDAFHTRIARWLGAHASECDVALFERLNLHPDEYATEQILGADVNADQLEEWRAFYGKMKAKRVILGHLIIERHSAPSKALCIRHALGPRATVQHMEETLELHRGSALSQPLYRGGNWHLRVRHTPDEKGLRARQYTFETAHPFTGRLHVPAWAAQLASKADGSVTAAEYYQQLVRGRVSSEEYQHLINELLARRIVVHAPTESAEVSPLDVDLEPSEAWFPDGNPLRLDYLSLAEQGEEKLMTKFAEIAASIRPGGHQQVLFTGWDRAFVPMEERVRASVFNVDIGLFVEKVLPPKVYARGMVMAENSYSWKMQEWGALCQRLHVQRIVIGRIVFQRPAAEREVFAIRRTVSAATDDNEILGLMRWEGSSLEEGFEERLMNATLAPGRGWELFARHEWKADQLVATDHTVISHYPFETTIHCPLWLVMVAAKADGLLTGAQLHEWVQLKAPVPATNFVRAVAALVGAGILRTELHAVRKQ